MRVLTSMFVVGAVVVGINGSIENYKLMNGMGINPIETVFLGLMSVMFGIVKYWVPVMCVLLFGGIFVHKKLTGKMLKILPTDVRIALAVAGVVGVLLGGYFYNSFVSGRHINTTLVQTSGQVGILVFLVIFFVLMALFNLCNIGKNARVLATKDGKK